MKKSKLKEIIKECMEELNEAPIKFKTPSEAFKKIEYITNQIMKSNAWREKGGTLEAIGPWIHAIQDIAKGMK